LVEPVAVSPRSVRIPLLGRIAAGSPIEAAEVRDEYIDIGSNFTSGGEVYALRVKGQSMIEDHIDNGDIVIVRKQGYASEGETVVAIVVSETGPADGEATLKRFYREKGGKIRLQPRNSAMDPMIYDAERVEIRGVAVGILRQI